MLQLAIIALALGAGYAVYIAPTEQRVAVGAVLVILTVIGYIAGYALTRPNTDERTYYPIAAALGGAMIAFGWISRKQKTWPKKGGGKQPGQP